MLDPHETVRHTRLKQAGERPQSRPFGYTLCMMLELVPHDPLLQLRLSRDGLLEIAQPLEARGQPQRFAGQ